MQHFWLTFSFNHNIEFLCFNPTADFSVVWLHFQFFSPVLFYMEFLSTVSAVILLGICYSFVSLALPSSPVISPTCTYTYSFTHTLTPGPSFSLPEVSVHHPSLTLVCGKCRDLFSVCICIASFYFVIFFWAAIEFGHIYDTRIMFIVFDHLLFFPLNWGILIYNYK